MLIVNADDFGASRNTTDAVLGTVDGGAVTSVSAMVWMPDSTSAAALARERGMSVGLHLNLSLPFTAKDVPTDVAQVQARLTTTFTKEGWRGGRTQGRTARADVTRAVNDQLGEFRRLFGEPAHINGHHHVHIIDVVLDTLPPDIPIRQALATPGTVGERDRRHASIAKRFRTTTAALDLRSIHPDLGGSGFDVLELAREGSLEVVTHPQLRDERDALLGQAWREAVKELELGSFSEL